MPLSLDGRLDKPFWEGATWTEEFIDIQGEHMPRPRFATRAKMLWDDECFYIGAHLEEPHVWGTLTEHDSVIFHDNDFEVFLDPNGDHHMYAEIEINALNTTWDLLLVRPYRSGGPAVDGFELHGMRTAVHVQGTLNDPSDEDRFWSVEIVIPWKALRQIAGTECPPKPGGQWRVNFSRVQWEHEVVEGAYRKVAGKPEDNWVWSPQGVVDMHRPWMWGVVQFEQSTDVPPRDLQDWEIRTKLVQVYEAQRAFLESHSRYATVLCELGLELPDVDLQALPSIWTATCGRWTIDAEARLRPSR
jgi:hypothetical protein